MGMSSIPSSVGSMLNSGLTQQGSQQQDIGNPSIGMPYGPGYTDPNQPGPGDVSIGMPAGPGYMQPSSGGKGGMPAPSPVQGPEPVFNFGNPSIGLPAGPGYMQPKQSFNPNPNPVSNMGAGQMPAPQPINMPGSIGMPAGPGYMPAPVPQTTQQIAQQVGLRTNPVQSRNVAAPRIVTTAMQTPQQIYNRARENVPVVSLPSNFKQTVVPSQSMRTVQPQTGPRIAGTGSLRRR